MLSPTNSLGPSPSRRSRKFPKILTVSPKIAADVHRPSIMTKQHSPEMKSEDQIIEESSPIFKPFPPSCKKKTIKKFTLTPEILQSAISFDNDQDRELIANILEVPPRRRTPQEIAVLHKAFNEIKFFKESQNLLDEISYEKIFQSLTLETYYPGDKIFHYGDIGKKFYIIIQGSVFVLLKAAGVTIDDVKGQEEDAGEFLQHLRDKLHEVLNSETTSDEVKTNFVERCNPGFWVVKNMIGGESFGELALDKSSDGKRTATIIAKEKVSLGILSAEDYHTILGNLYERKYRDDLDFIKCVNIFQHWRMNALPSVILNSQTVEFKRKQIIFREGDPCDRIYFIKKGEVELIKTVERSENIEKPAPSKRIRNVPVPKKLLIKKHEIAKMGIQLEKDYLGEYELLNETPMEYTAIAHSTHVTLLTIRRDKFFNLVKDELSMKCLNDQINKKRAWREELLQRIMTCHPQPQTRGKSSEPSSMEDLGPKRTSLPINIQLSTDYFPDFNRAVSPQNRLQELRKIPLHLDEEPSSLVFEKPVTSTKASSGILSATLKVPVSHLLETEPSATTKNSLSHFMSTSISPRKSLNQTTYDSSRKWLQITPKKAHSPDDKHEDRSADARRSTSINFHLSGKTPKLVKLEPITNSKQAEVRSEARKTSKVWSHYLHSDKVMLKQIGEKNRPSIKAKVNHSVNLNKVGLNITNQLNEDMMMRDVIAGKHYSPLKEILKKDDRLKEKPEKPEKPVVQIKTTLNPDKNVYFNTEGNNFEAPSPLVRSVILSYRRINDLRKDNEKSPTTFCSC